MQVSSCEPDLVTSLLHFPEPDIPHNFVSTKCLHCLLCVMKIIPSWSTSSCPLDCVHCPCISQQNIFLLHLRPCITCVHVNVCIVIIYLFKCMLLDIHLCRYFLKLKYYGHVPCSLIYYAHADIGEVPIPLCALHGWSQVWFHKIKLFRDAL